LNFIIIVKSRHKNAVTGLKVKKENFRLVAIKILKR